MRISRTLLAVSLLLACPRAGAAQSLSRPVIAKAAVPSVTAMLGGLMLSLSPLNPINLEAARTPGTVQALPVLPPQAVPNVAATVPLAQPAPQAEEHRPGAFASLQAAVWDLFHPSHTAPEQRAALQAAFDGSAPASGKAAGTGLPGALDPVRPGPPGMMPHSHVPVAILPDGTPILPESFAGGFHGTDIPPQKVVKEGGFPERGPEEDWRLKEHSEGASRPKSAFRGATPFASMPSGDVGAAYWAGEGGWVYKVKGVPTWGIESSLEGRVEMPDGSYRGSLMHEAENAIPARMPLECIEGWGQVSASGDKLYVRTKDWVPNPRYNAADCRRFWGSRSQLPN